MTKRNNIVVLFLLAAGLLAGCSTKNEPEQKNEITLRTGVTGLQRRAHSIGNNAALQTQDLKIDAYFHDTETKYLDGKKLHYNSTSWIFWDGSAQEHYYWPFDGAVYDPEDANITYTSLDFVGYCPFTKPAYIGTPTYDYSTGITFTCDMSNYMTLARQSGDEAPTIPEFQEYVVSILDAQTLATQTAAGGALPMQFKHPMAQIKFVITAASGEHVQINSIKIEDLKTSGTCNYDGSAITWSSLSGEEDMTLTQELKIGGTTTSMPFFVLPYNYGTKYLTVNATWDDWSSDVTISDYGTNVNFEWLPGCSYTYNLTLDKYGLKVDIQKYTEQW